MDDGADPKLVERLEQAQELLAAIIACAARKQGVSELQIEVEFYESGLVVLCEACQAATRMRSRLN